MPSVVSFSPRFVSHKFTQAEIGWHLVASASPFLIPQITLKSIQYILQTIALFLNSLEFGAKTHLYQILLIELIGIALIFDNKFNHLERVTPSL